MGFWSITCCENPIQVLDNLLVRFSNRNMTCEGCGIRFSFLKKKRKCQECLKDFCSACVWRDAVLLPRHQLCRTCHTLTTVPLDRSELMQLRIRELQHFLMARNIPVNSCTEKRDLVDLVIRFSARTHSPTSSPSRTNNVHRGDSTQESTYPSQFTTPTTTTTTTTTTSANDFTKDAANQETGDGEKKLRIEDILDMDVEQLSIRQLKEILSRSFVTYKGCCEKQELVGKVKQLQEEAKQNHLRVMQGLPEESTCKICMDAPIDCVLLECGHMLSCTKCGQLLSECPVCRQFVVRVVHTFRA